MIDDISVRVPDLAGSYLNSLVDLDPDPQFTLVIRILTISSKIQSMTFQNKQMLQFLVTKMSRQDPNLDGSVTK
jgi:hypothetical protein